jgi:hypothetical protein
MKRIFSIEFGSTDFKGKAIISVAKTENQSFYHIQLMDSIACNLFSGSHIRYRGDDGFKNLHFYKYPSHRRILKAISVAINKELNRDYSMVKRLFR